MIGVYVMKSASSKGNKGNKTWTSRLSDEERKARDEAREREYQAALERAKGWDTRELAMEFVPNLHDESSTEMSGPCPVCKAGTDRFHVKRDGWFCRVCHPIERGWYSNIDLLMMAGGYSFEAAFERLGQPVGLILGIDGKPKVVNTEANAKAWAQEREEDKSEVPEKAWREEQGRVLAQARAALRGGGKGFTYLRGRGLEEKTWEAFGMGFGSTWDGAEAVLMPWYSDGVLVAVRYRLLVPVKDGDKRTRKVLSKSGSHFRSHLYGVPGTHLDRMGGATRTLIFTEGELNAASVWQALDGKVDVLSTGSESHGWVHAMDAVLPRYKAVISWFDDALYAERWHARVNHPNSLFVVSPIVDGKSLDANDLLRRGKLADYLRAQGTRLGVDL